MICFYDGQASQQAIRSIGSRTLSDFECVIIDDGSTDNSAALIESHARHDPRIVVVYQKNTGLIASLNRAVGMPRAAVAARTTTRDIAVPSRLEGQVDAMRRDRAALHSCVPHIVTTTGQVRAVMGTYADTDFAPWFILLFNFVAGHSQVMSDRDLSIGAGLYDGSDFHVEDYGLSRLLRKGRFEALPQEVHQYEFHNANDSRTRMDPQIEGLVTLARGQLLDLSFEQPRADLRSLRHFWFCGPSAADWVPWGHGSLRRRRFASEEIHTTFASSAPTTRPSG